MYFFENLARRLRTTEIAVVSAPAPCRRARRTVKDLEMRVLSSCVVCHLNISGELRDGPRARAVGVERPRLLPVSSEQINRRAVEAYRQVLAEALQARCAGSRSGAGPASQCPTRLGPCADAARPDAESSVLAHARGRSRPGRCRACRVCRLRSARRDRAPGKDAEAGRPPAAEIPFHAPSPEDRFKDLRIDARKLMPLYPDAKRG